MCTGPKWNRSWQIEGGIRMRGILSSVISSHVIISEDVVDSQHLGVCIRGQMISVKSISPEADPIYTQRTIRMSSVQARARPSTKLCL